MFYICKRIPHPLKLNKYDIYLSGLLIKTNASLEEVIALKLILTK